AGHPLKKLARTHDDTYPQFAEEILAPRGVTPEYSSVAYQRLISVIEELISNEENKEQAEQKTQIDTSNKDWSKTKIKFFKTALQTLQEHQKEAPPQALYYFQLAKKMIYSVFAQDYEDQRQDNNKENAFNGEAIKKTVGSVMRFKERANLFVLPLTDQHSPIGSEQGAEESKFLKASKNNEEIGLLSPLEIANIDIPDDHPALYSDAFMQQNPDLDIWERNEKYLNKTITKDLEEKFHLKEHFPQFQYDLHQAHKILFFKSIKDSGTSPKIKTKDAFNVSWKIKWLDEMQAEVIANRLYSKIGGKFTDITYMTMTPTDLGSKGAAGLTLILSDPNDNDDSDGPKTAEELVNQLYFSKSKGSRFDLSPYISQTGVITPNNAEQILADLSPEAQLLIPIKSLIGRHYVTFKEAMVEINPRVVERGGPVTYSSFDADNDRVFRSLLLFNSWINNNDVRSANNKSLLLKNFPGEKNKWTYIETEHDMGKSLGGHFGSANPNRLPIGDKYLFIDRANNLHFNYFVLQAPGAWFNATYADLLWMGKRIVKITRNDIEQIVAETLWPDFQQQAMVYKLLARRNQMASALGITDLLPVDERIIFAPSLSIPLHTHELRVAAAQRYHLAINLLEDNNELFSDQVLTNGTVSNSRYSVLVRLLQQHCYPSGLERRSSRYSILNKINPQNRRGGINFNLL
ncbi:MAG: hypothetical protein HQK53_19265, partial [Oligoflexia bacterium]|nr:hypothetical protein [Oligoflexia bacterium]